MPKLGIIFNNEITLHAEKSLLSNINSVYNNIKFKFSCFINSHLIKYYWFKKVYKIKF